MSEFFIFASVLTVAYLIYFGVNIFRDLHATSSQKSDSVETFDVSGMGDEDDSVVISENSPSPKNQDSEEPPVVYIGESSGQPSPASSDNSNSPTLVSKTQDLEEIDPEDDFSLDNEGYAQYLMTEQPINNTRNIKKIATNDII